MRRPSRAFEAAVDLWDFGATSLTFSRITLARMHRTARHTLDGDDRFSFLFMRDGVWRGDMGGQVMVELGLLLGFDYKKPVNVVGHTASSVSLTVSRPVMDALAPRRPEIHGLTFENAPARLLADHLMLLTTRLSSIDEQDLLSVEKVTLDLLGRCLGNAARLDLAHNVASAARTRQRVMRFIDDNLTAPDLTPDRISDELGYSRSSLYRAFGTDMGIASYIRRRRLMMAHTWLAAPQPRRKIADVAAQLNFVSEAHFSRVFRDAFGYSPKHARRTTTQG